MLPTYTPPFIADRVVGSFVGVCGMCLGVLSALLMGAIPQQHTAFSGFETAGRGMGIPEPPPPDLTTPMAITAALVALYLICAAGIFFSRAWGFWLSIGLLLVSLAAGSAGIIGALLSIALIVYSGLRLSGAVGTKPTWN